MALGLDKLASNLEDDQCKHIREFYKKEEVFRLMRRKGVYPYKYTDDWEKFEETSLPPKNAFYSMLNMKNISDQDHEHAQQVWNIMEKKTHPRLLSRYLLKRRCIAAIRRVLDIRT